MMSELARVRPDDDLTDSRDRTVFIEYYADFRLTSVWHENGKLDYYLASQV